MYEVCRIYTNLKIIIVFFSSNLIPTVYTKLIVSNVYPREGSIQGGTNLTITGDGFGTNVSKASVSLGDGIDCLIETITDTQIKCQIAYAGRKHPVTNNGVSQGMLFICTCT